MSTEQKIGKELGYYVYALIDPRDGTPFYIGKGRGERYAEHGKEAFLDAGQSNGKKDTSKVERIRAIRSTGLEPVIWIVRHGMETTDEYTHVEAACIDLLSSFPVERLSQGALRRPNECTWQLTNARKEEVTHGIEELEILKTRLSAPELTTKTPLFVATLTHWEDKPEGEIIPGGGVRYGNGFRPEWALWTNRSDYYSDVAKSACAWWAVSPDSAKQRGIEHAVAQYAGITRVLLQITSWHQHPEDPKRFGFEYEIVTEGTLFDEVVGTHGHRIPGTKQNSKYWPTGFQTE